MAGCIFCDILAGKRPASLAHRDDLCAAFMDTSPVNEGHLLVVPNRHATGLADLDAKTGEHLFGVAQRLAGALRRSGVRCEAVTLLLADGEAAQQEIFHVHLHVIPRFKGDGFGLRFPPQYGLKPERAELEDVAGRIRARIRD